MNAPFNSIESKLQACCEKYLDHAVRVENVKQLSGGASAETRRFYIVNNDTNEKTAAILRSSSIQQASQFSTSISKNTEANVQSLCAKHDIPVPDILFCLDESDDLGEGYAMSCIEGATIPRKILRDEIYTSARSKMTQQCGDILGKIHRIDMSTIDIPLEDQSPLKQLDQLEKLYRSYQRPSAVFELAFQWLRQNAPQDHRYTLVHGDFRNGNIVVDESGIVGVLDWELCHLGDPVEDLGWLCVNAWCFGSEKPVGGFGEFDELLQSYEAQTNVTVTHQQLHYWQVFGTLRWGIICLFQANCFTSGLNRSVELAAIGRRVSETEIDLLNLWEAL